MAALGWLKKVAERGPLAGVLQDALEWVHHLLSANQCMALLPGLWPKTMCGCHHMGLPFPPHILNTISEQVS